MMLHPSAQTQALSAPDPTVAEELLDLVLQHCRAGQADTAQRLAQDIKAQFATEPAIDALLAPIMAGACQPRQPDSQSEIHLSIGRDDNINLGVLTRTVSLGGPMQPITYQLDDSYQPVSTLYATLTGMHQQRMANGWQLQATAGLRQLTQYSPLNTLGLQLTARKPVALRSLPGQLSLSWSETWLGGSHYRSAPTVQWQSQPSQGRQGWIVNAQIQHQNLSDSTLDATLLETSISYQVRPSASSQINAGAGWTNDNAHHSRAGGDRHGLHLQAGWQHASQSGIWHAQWLEHQWQTAQAFLPGLIDQRRSHRTTTWTMGYQRPMAKGRMVYIDYQRRNSRDNIPLYTHQSNQLAVGWVIRWP
jgi:hypothetical protein